MSNPPSGTILRLTALQRAMADAHGLAQRGDFDAVSPSDGTLQAMAAELKVLKNRVWILYAATALGSFLVLSQAGATAEIDLLGIKFPLSILSKQALSVLLAAAFSYYAGAVVSAAMLYGTMAAIVMRAATEGWDFLLAKFDAEYLWINMLREKKMGAPSPGSEKAIALMVSVSNRAVVLGHILLVIAAVGVSLREALDSGLFWGIILASLAMIGVLAAAIGGLSACFLKLSYRIP